MTPYFQSQSSKNRITCNADLVISDDNKLLLVSLCDIQIKNKKICADLINYDYGTSVDLKDREDINFKKHFYNYRDENKYRFKSEPMDNYLTHTMIYNTEINQYIINWNNENKASVVTKYLRNIHYIPVTEEIVEMILKKDEENNKAHKLKYSYCSYSGIIKDLQIYTNNPIYKDLKAYSINVTWFKQSMEALKIEDADELDNFNWDEIEDVEDYIFTFLPSIKEKLKENITTLYNKNNISPYIFEGKYKPFEGQIPIIQSGIEVLKRDRFIYLCAEMGTGKTLMSTKINHAYHKEKNKNNYVTLIVAPSITLTQWKTEIENSIADKVNIYTIKKTDDFINIYNKSGLKFDKPTYFLIGKETFKLDSKKKAGVNVYKKLVTYKKEISTRWYTDLREVTEPIIIACCPDCGKPLKNELRKKEDVFFTEDDFKGNPKKSNYRCPHCKAILWQCSYDKTKKTSLIRFIKTKKIMFDSVINDELHQSNNSESLIGSATRTLFNHTKKSILLSGTSNSGYSSGFHNIMMGLLSNKLINNNVMELDSFIKTYGTLQAKSQRKDGDYLRSGRSEIKDSDYKEIEGINPIFLTKFMISNFIFATLDDLSKELPKLNEYYCPIQNDEIMSRNEGVLINDIKKTASFNCKMYENTIGKHYINNPFNWNSILIENGEKEDYIQPKNLSNENILLQKEIELVKIIKKEMSEGRKCCIYVDFNNGGQYMNGTPLPNRIENILKKEGVRVFQLKPSVPTYDRKELIEKKQNDFDVLITNPMLVQVGLNLVFIPTYINYIPNYRYDIVSQSNRRGYRINAKLENRIYHLYYTNSLEDTIIKRYQRKLAEAQAIESKFNVNIENESIRTNSVFGKKLSDNIKSTNHH